MNLMGVGLLEMLVILLVAFLALGPFAFDIHGSYRRQGYERSP